jgi:UDP-N-acetylmuramoylalanine--D-glutamate ligase
VLFALQALQDVDCLIIGGLDRGIDYAGFVDGLLKSGIGTLVCMPETGHSIGKRLVAVGTVINIVFVEDMEQAVNKAFEMTKAGKSCLLSPAAPSYNRYKSFEEKGRQFKSLVSEWTG